MNCPTCNHTSACVGAVTVECPNFHCRHYSIRQYRDYVDAASSTSKPPAGSESTEHDDNGTAYHFGWSTHHHDFGDI